MKRNTDSALIDAVLPMLDSVKELQPTGLGEPMISPDFWRLTDEIERRQGRLRLRFHTNAILLNAQRIARISKVPIANINISIDAASAETYGKVRGWDFEKCVKNIGELAKALRAVDDPARPEDYIQISCVLMRENIEEIPDFVRLADRLGIKFVYFEHLIEPDMAAHQWTVYRGEYRFNYGEQMLIGDASASDPHLIKAYDVAEQLGIGVKGVGLIQSKQNLHHEQRDCRFHTNV